MSKMQSSNLKEANKIRDSYETEFLRECFEIGYNCGHGIACHNVPEIGEKIWLDGEGEILIDEDNIEETHRLLCFDAEMNSRCYSPWEVYAHKINSHDDFEEGWIAYGRGVETAIDHDLSEYDYD